MATPDDCEHGPVHFLTEVVRTFQAAHHNGPPRSRCYTNHGHSWTVTVRIPFRVQDLNKFGWGPDFSIIKAVIDRLDHKDLNEELTVPPSAENVATHIFNEVERLTRFTPGVVEVEEGNGNKVMYFGS